MIRRRIVRAVIAIVFAVSAAAWSGWFVDRGEAAEEASVDEQVWLESSPAAADVAGQAAVEAGSTVDIEGEARVVQADADADKETTTGNQPVIIKAGSSGYVPDSGSAPSKDNSTKTLPDKPAGKTVYLTFDDGPSKLTPQVLDILKKEGIKATFFVLGEHVNEHPDLLKRIVEEGHTVGNHTYDHQYKELYNSFGEFARQIVKTEEALQAAAGIRTKLVRAPGGTYGNFDQSYFDAMTKAGYTMFDWNVDSGDSVRVGVPAAEIIKNIHNSKLSDETVVLLHDSSIHGESVKALPEIIRYYKEKGYTFAPLTEAVKPVTFRLADKLKWSRPKATSAEETSVREGLEAKGASPFVFSGELEASAGKAASAETGSTTAAAQDGQELVVYAADRTLIFEPGAYWAHGEGDWLIPLRDMIEALNGKLSWSASDRKVRIVLPSGTSFDLKTGDGQPGIVQQGKVYASLREVLLQIEGKPVEAVQNGNQIVFGNGGNASTTSTASAAA
ncbi:peptidoglycan/xylan/chitin deacetylase (PgdA/CDA1 family) [Paenibacillus cellulosilyticus]|uniref:Peptidoglycan/xylan/chitin deacetylase (PgdA/CDA1 family) n=1 Tax=Paenibacillus cellulosilyticus TaxID=375489 RepID=A0A2V2YP91_9BACL|nr:polysaccharide deacetylase family protein [Paenibacillus cellulosilyticus]PWV97920.1 peptidoglycan/xylan/chitin deacetylase (PgdA/CDA1 family) [Paenibacillus cellulosilyticus]QKS44041.1 polysaccharide deacetylase [Paenibacillus cellulosilyticus]